MKKLFRKIKAFFGHPWWTPNKESRKVLREEADRLIGWDKRINRSWDKSWKYFIKRDYPWYGIIELNQFKIIQMREYMKFSGGIDPKEIKKQVNQMNEVIDLGHKIIENDYNEEAYAFLRINSVNVTLIYKKKGETELDGGTLGKFKLPIQGEPLAKLYNTGLFEEFLDENNSENIPENAKKTREEWLKGKETRSLTKWLSDNGLKRDQVATAYTSEWTNGKTEEENHKIYLELFKKCQKEYQKDINNYFKLIAKYYNSWGD